MPATKRVDPEREQMIATLYQDGLAVTLMAEKLGISRQTIYNALIRQGIETNRRRPEPPEVADAYRLLAQELLTKLDLARHQVAELRDEVGELRAKHERLAAEPARWGPFPTYDALRGAGS